MRFLRAAAVRIGDGLTLKHGGTPRCRKGWMSMVDRNFLAVHYLAKANPIGGPTDDDGSRLRNALIVYIPAALQSRYGIWQWMFLPIITMNMFPQSLVFFVGQSSPTEVGDEFAGTVDGPTA